MSQEIQSLGDLMKYRLEYGIHLGSAQAPFLMVDSCYRGEGTAHYVQLGTTQIDLGDWRLYYARKDDNTALQVYALGEGRPYPVSYVVQLEPEHTNGLLLLSRDRVTKAPSAVQYPRSDLINLRARYGINNVQIGDPNLCYKVEWMRDEDYEQTETVFADGKVTCLRSAWKLTDYSGWLEFDMTDAHWAIKRRVEYSPTTGKRRVLRTLITSVHPMQLQFDLMRLQMLERTNKSATLFGTIK